MNSFIDLAHISKVLMGKNRYPSVQQELERLSPSTRGGGRGGGGESRELQKVGAGESSASTTTDTNIGFATPSTTKRTITEICGQKTCRDQRNHMLNCASRNGLSTK